MEDYDDFYCCECKYYTILNDRKKGTDRNWCDKQEQAVNALGAGCPFFELEEDDKL